MNKGECHGFHDTLNCPAIPCAWASLWLLPIVFGELVQHLLIAFLACVMHLCLLRELRILAS
jgi:hypothetical protein